jgi:hypothetical protein
MRKQQLIYYAIYIYIMEFTFGIITTGSNDKFLEKMIVSIENNKIPVYEIIIVGNTKIASRNNVKILFFDETIKEGWITRKKNIISQTAKYENIVLLHDYIELKNDWYAGFLKFGNNFKFCVNRILNENGVRFRDYSLFPYKVDYLNINYSPSDIYPYFADYCLLPYDYVNTIKTNRYMYISGSYYVIKKQIANTYLLDEELVWGRGEDVEFSKRLHSNGIIIQCNPFSTVQFLKYKNPMHWEREIHPKAFIKFIEFCENH